MGAIIVSLVVGFTRLYLGAHWLTDVLGAYALGTAWLFALLFTRSDVRTLTIIVPSLVGGHEILWGQVAAVGVVAIIPNILLALLLQRFLVRGLTLGAVKG